MVLFLLMLNTNYHCSVKDFDRISNVNKFKYINDLKTQDDKIDKCNKITYQKGKNKSKLVIRFRVGFLIFKSIVA